jgi:lia operon protein LiaF
LHVDLSGVNMRNVEVSGFAGDIDVITSRGELSGGLNRLIISEFLGDIKVFVPREWQVFVHCSNFAGDVDILGRRSEGVGNTLEVSTDEYETAERKLYIAISSFVGDVKVLQV